MKSEKCNSHLFALRSPPIEKTEEEVDIFHFSLFIFSFIYSSQSSTALSIAAEMPSAFLPPAVAKNG